MPIPESKADAGRAGYTPEQCARMSLELERQRAKFAYTRLDLAGLAHQLTVDRAKTFANEGIGRRLPVIERCVANVFTLYPPTRAEFLSRDELNDVAIHLHAFSKRRSQR